MLKKAIIIIKGDVQEAGYRALIRKTAQKLNLNGTVENLPDGNVNIICEGEEEKIKKFCKEIKIKTLTVDIENIEVKYEDYEGEFKDKGFRVRVSDLGDELFQGYATATKYFMIGFEKQDKMLEKQDKTLNAINSMHKDLKEGFKEIGNKLDKSIEEIKNVGDKIEIVSEKIGKSIEEIKSFANQTEQQFSHLNNKYHVISQSVIAYLESQKKTEEQNTKIIEMLTAILNELVRRSEK